MQARVISKQNFKFVAIGTCVFQIQIHFVVKKNITQNCGIFGTSNFRCEVLGYCDVMPCSPANARTRNAQVRSHALVNDREDWIGPQQLRYEATLQR